MDFKKSDLKRYGVLFFGLIMAAGFTFGGMASMSSMIQTPSGSEDNSIDAELPGSQYAPNGYNLTDNEKMYLAATETKVFVTGYYDEGNQSQKEMLSQLQQLNEVFGDAVYVELSTSTSGQLLNSAGITNYPAIIVNGGVTRQGSPRAQPVTNVTEVDIDQMTETICRIMPSYPNDASAITCV
jgi:hypothetical protein